jgi:hypothetical protein
MKGFCNPAGIEFVFPVFIPAVSRSLNRRLVRVARTCRVETTVCCCVIQLAGRHS